MTKKNKVGRRQRLRDSFSAGEERSRTDEALLELLLSYAIPQKDVWPLAKRLLAEHENLSEVLAADIDTLCNVDGIKYRTAVLLKLTDWIRNIHTEHKISYTEVPQHGNSDQMQFDFRLAEAEEQRMPKPKKSVSQKPAVSRRGTEMFTNAVLKEAINLLPLLPETESLDEIREHLLNNLHYSAEQTRRRYAAYIIRRMFPQGYADSPMLSFTKYFQGKQEQREVCFYRFIKAEPLMVRIAEQLLLPSIGNARLKRQKIRDFLTGEFPSAKSINQCAQAVVDALGAGGIVKVDRLNVVYGYRDILIPAFAFILHGEFPEPGMYDIAMVESSPTINAMLWNPSNILQCLYELRNQGIISKVSVIDNVRQFTTKWSLERVVDHLVSGENI